MPPPEKPPLTLLEEMVLPVTVSVAWAEPGLP